MVVEVVQIISGNILRLAQERGSGRASLLWARVAATSMSTRAHSRIIFLPATKQTTQLASSGTKSQRGIFASIRKQKLCAASVVSGARRAAPSGDRNCTFSPVIMTNDNVCAACPSRFSHAVWLCAKYAALEQEDAPERPNPNEKKVNSKKELLRDICIQLRLSVIFRVTPTVGANRERARSAQRIIALLDWNFFN
jgi:hypothetical protein